MKIRCFPEQKRVFWLAGDVTSNVIIVAMLGITIIAVVRALTITPVYPSKCPCPNIVIVSGLLVDRRF
jgi:hypothetical protein